MPDTSVTSAPSKTRHRTPQPSPVHGSPRGVARGQTDTQERRFAAVRAVQARRAYFVTACPLALVPEILSFDAPDRPDKHVVIDAAHVRRHLEELVKDEDLSRFIL